MNNKKLLYLAVILSTLPACHIDRGEIQADLDGDGFTTAEGDCDDEDPSVHPGAREECDGKDNDCDDRVDEGCDIDDDGDGYTESDGDCDDEDPSIYPGAEEVCDGMDNDCDSEADEGCGEDGDGDGYTAEEGDCDDEDPSIYPGAEEVCDGMDNDCDSEADEGCGEDGDGDGYTAEEGDCDDSDPAVYPAADEVPYDGIDQDCDGADLTDADHDEYDAVEAGGDDCDDTDNGVNPGEDDERDGIDNDCDGITDPLEFFDRCDISRSNLWGGYWWTFTDSGSGGTSTIASSDSTENHAGDPDGCSMEITGAVTDDTWYGEGYIGFGTDLNEDALAEDLSSFSSLTFSALGDGNTWRVCVMMEGVADYDYHCSGFAPGGSWQVVNTPFSSLEQAGWGEEVLFSPDAIIGVEFVTAEYPISSLRLLVDGLYFE